MHVICFMTCHPLIGAVTFCRMPVPLSVLLRAGIPEVEAGCLELQSINMNGCVTLFRLALEQQPVLERMEASGCKALRHAASSSSVLRACFLQSCPRLVVKHLHVIL